jgi:hypothetical protein
MASRRDSYVAAANEFLVWLARIVYRLEQEEPDAVVHAVPLDEIVKKAGLKKSQTARAIGYLDHRGDILVKAFPSGNRGIVITEQGKEAAELVGGSKRIRNVDGSPIT